MHFFQNAISFELLCIGFVWNNIQALTKTQPYIFLIVGLRFLLQDTEIENPD